MKRVDIIPSNGLSLSPLLQGQVLVQTQQAAVNCLAVSVIHCPPTKKMLCKRQMYWHVA